MRKVRWASLFATAAVLAAILSAGLLLAAPRGRPMRQPDLDITPPFDFKSTWDETLRFNTAAWQKDMLGSGIETRIRMSRRTAVLLEAMVEKFPAEKAKIAAAADQVIDLMFEAGMTDRACRKLKARIDGAPGDIDLAKAGLARMLRQMHWEEFSHLDGGAE